MFARLARPVVDEEEGFDVNNDEAILKNGSRQCVSEVQMALRWGGSPGGSPHLAQRQASRLISRFRATPLPILTRPPGRSADEFVTLQGGWYKISVL